MSIFSWISPLFGKKPDQDLQSASAQGRVGGEITFKPELVEQLKSEHRLLEKSFGALVHAHGLGDYDACVSHLKRFTSILRAHLLKENTLLYVYLKYALQNDSESSQLVHSMRIEMQQIGKILNQFATEYVSGHWDEEKRNHLGADLKKIAEALQQRIGQEESVLYPLYLPPSHYRLVENAH